MAMRQRAYRKSLILAAIQLFAQRGYHATSVRMIAKAARSSKGGFYHHFRHKDDICAAILESLVTAVARTTPGTPQQLRSTVRDLVLLLTSNPDAARILILESSALGPRLDKVRRDIVESIANFFVQLLAQWSPPPPDCSVAARCIVGGVYESVRHWIELPPDQRPTSRALATTVADFSVRAITAPPSEDFSQSQKKIENHKERTVDSSVSAI
jgi:AcrR family transcriptional regulator